MKTWQNLGDRAKLASFLAAMLASKLVTVLATWEPFWQLWRPFGCVHHIKSIQDYHPRSVKHCKINYLNGQCHDRATQKGPLGCLRPAGRRLSNADVIHHKDIRGHTGDLGNERGRLAYKGCHQERNRDCR
ncbi:hypothetical protein TNCV_4124431 [Trichonephila clavipes]|nr:hypothetical protein TNCV_4124431 [Trichonephila clavipes]